MENLRVFKLLPDLDGPKFSGFANDGYGVLFNTAPAVRRSRNWKVKRLKSSWVPPKVRGRANRGNDYPCVDWVVPAFSERAVEALRDLLEPNGEILPLNTQSGEFFAYNVTTVADVLVEEQSKFTRAKDGITVRFVERFVFDKRRVGQLSIFRIPQLLIDYFVTTTFSERSREHDLNGILLDEVWACDRKAT